MMNKYGGLGLGREMVYVIAADSDRHKRQAETKKKAATKPH